MTDTCHPTVLGSPLPQQILEPKQRPQAHVVTPLPLPITPPRHLAVCLAQHCSSLHKLGKHCHPPKCDCRAKFQKNKRPPYYKHLFFAYGKHFCQKQIEQPKTVLYSASNTP